MGPPSGGAAAAGATNADGRGKPYTDPTGQSTRTTAGAQHQDAASIATALGGRRSGTGWMARCPSHDDANASLSIAEGQRGVVVKCFAGCTQEDVIAALRGRGLWPEAQRHGRSATGNDTEWEIRDATGALVAVHVRRPIPGPKKKKFLWRLPDGTWNLGGRKTADLPLYGAELLPAVAPGTAVVFTEGEQAADALRRLGVVAVSSVTGAAGTPSADVLRALVGFDVTLWRDHDQPGAQHMARIAGRLATLGVSARVVEWPDAREPGDDAADFVARGGTREQLDALLREATPPSAAAAAEVKSAGKPCFELKPNGLYSVVRNHDGSLVGEEWICSPIRIPAKTRDGDSEDWGRLIEVKDPDGVKHRWAMPMSMLAGDGTECRAELLRLGLLLAPGKTARDRLNLFITTADPKTSARCVSRTGWHGDAYVLPDQTFGAASEEVVLQSSAPGQAHLLPRGTLEDWQRTVGTYCLGNSRLAFVVSAAFAAPLLHPLGEESGGMNIRGNSSLGKTNLLRAAASVNGMPSHDGYLRSWRLTINGLEGTAELMCDALLCLDELGQVSAREAGEVVYMIAGGAGKIRARRDGSARRPKTWRTLVLSTGEVSLADKMGETGQFARAGQQVRLLDIPADAGAGFGAFEQLHGFDRPEDFVASLRQASESYFGTPIRSFLDKITQRNREELVRDLRATMSDWKRLTCPDDASEQVGRAADRFALIAAAGELATEVGVLPWEAGEARHAAKVCFHAWLTSRGGKEAAEVTTAIARVRLCLEKYGESRFPLIGVDDVRADNRITLERWGFRKRVSGRIDYLIMVGPWETEVCKGIDRRHAAKALADRGFLIRDPRDKKLQSRHSLPDLGDGLPGGAGQRVYQISSAIFGSEEADGE